MGYRSLRKADTADMRERDKTRGTSASKRRYRTTLNDHRVVYPPPLNMLIVSITFGLRPPTFHRYSDNSLRARDTLLERVIRELGELPILRIELRVSSFEQI